MADDPTSPRTPASQRATPPVPPPSHPRPGPAPLGASLGGDLPCVVCGYNLRGLSIRSTCPECGTAVRATILAVVDPLARELRPVRSRWVVAGGLIVWSASALIAALLAWTPHLADAAAAMGLGHPRTPPVTLTMTTMVVLSGVGALALVSPHRALPRRNIMAALGAVLLYVPAAYLVWCLGDLTQRRTLSPMLDAGGLDAYRSQLRLLLDLCTIGIVLGLRPNGRVLVARSLALRSGRVDRQTLFAIALAAAVAAVGDAIHLFLANRGGNGTHEIAFLAGTAFVAMGSALITGGFAGSTADCLRIARAVLSPGPSLAHVIDPPTGAGGESEHPA
jgi:hypothetical protein